MSNHDFSADLSDIEARLRAALERGREMGRLEERQRIERLLQTTSPGAEAATTGAAAPSDAHGPNRRVASGTIRPLVREILSAADEGLTKAEITRRVTARNPNIAAPSISNELSRNEKGGLKLYRRTRTGRWYINEANDDLPETEGPAVAEDDRPAGSMLNGSHQDGGSIATSGPDQ